jgi:phage/plasmid-like protein (TIGR03299 family)
MSHDLTLREDGKTEFFSAVTRGWHNLGQLSERKLTAEEAIKEALLDWSVEQTPCYHQTNDGELLQVPNQYVVRRTDTNSPLSIMSDRYVPIQNHEAFSFFDDIIGSGQAVWDTAGSIGGGRKVFMQAELEGKLFLNSNPDDTTVKRILFLTSHDGSKALTGMITPVRVVCQNTLNAALKDHSNCFKVYHRKNYLSYKEEAAKVLELAHAYFDDLQVVMNTLAEQEVSHSFVEGFIGTLMPAEKKEDGSVAKRTESRRTLLTDLFANGQGNNGRTKWDLYNAVTEYVDHHSAGRIGEARMARSEALANVEAEARFERAILGSGATMKQRALDLLLN